METSRAAASGEQAGGSGRCSSSAALGEQGGGDGGWISLARRRRGSRAAAQGVKLDGGTSLFQGETVDGGVVLLEYWERTRDWENRVTGLGIVDSSRELGLAC